MDSSVASEGYIDREELHLKLMRTFSLFAGPIVIAYRYIFLASDPEAVDPIGLRILIACLFAAFFVASHVNSFVRKHATPFYYAVQYATTAWLAYLTYLNSLSASVTLGFIVVIVTINFGFHTRRALALYALLVTTTVAIITVIVDEPRMMPLFFFSTIVTIAFFTYIMLHSRLKAEDELDRNEAIMETVFHESGDAFVVIDEHSGGIMSYNQTALAMLGLREIDEVLARLYACFEPDEEPRSEMGILALLIEKAPCEKKYLIANSNEELWVNCMIKRVKSNNQDMLLVKMADITADKQVDEYRIARDAAEEANRLKDEFMAVMSHELRTPMNGVIGMANLLEYTELDEEQMEYLQVIQNSGENLLKTLNDILDFTRLDSGIQDIEKEVFSPVLVLEEVINMVAADASAKKIELVALTAMRAHENVLGDAGKYRQILVNLIGNAVKFTQRGEIVVRLEKSPEERIKVSVRDTGIGIPAEQYDSIFDHFTQADASLSRKFEGTGLGLAITRRMVELLGGTISVESTLGVGSTFTFSIQVEPTEDAADTLGLEEELAVLIIDDNEASRERVELILSHVGAKSYATSDVPEALNRIANGDSVDIVCVDLFMPDADAIDVARSIKMDTNNDVLVILMAPIGVKVEFTSDTADALLTKPFSEEGIIRCIDAVYTPKITDIALDDDEIKYQSTALRILLVEDNIMNQRVALSSLKLLGFSADVAHNGAEALRLIDTEIYDIVFMDLQMPVMDGLAATEVIRARYSEGRPYIIALTANALESDYEKCVAAGMNDFISKPLSLPALKKSIETYEHICATSL